MRTRESRHEHHIKAVHGVFLMIPALVAGCGLSSQQLQELVDSFLRGAAPSYLAGQVASKAFMVADQIGGAAGFGGMLMNGYSGHMMDAMGFHGADDLADPNGTITVQFRNDADEACTFHFSYFARHQGLEEQMMDVRVPVGQEVSVDIPCAEIMGLGQLEVPGDAGCHFASGEAVDNRMTVPGFLGTDFLCDGMYHFDLMHDDDDLDGDGDTDEWILDSGAREGHMQFGGTLGQMPGPGGMMGGHMGP